MTELTHDENELFLLMKKVAENAPIVLFAIDKDGIFTLSEGKGLEKLGLKPGQVVGMSALEMYKDNPAVLDSIRSALEGKEALAMLHVGEGTFQTTMSPVRDESGEVVGLVGVATDVTELEATKRELVSRNEELNKAVKLMVGREKEMMEMKRKLQSPDDEDASGGA